MKSADFILYQLHHSAECTPSDADQALLNEHGLEEYIYGKLTSKKFRKWAMSDSAERRTRRAIEIATSGSKRLRVVHPFGGYKLWRLPTSPEIDWAEFFAITYYARYLAPITASYAPGVELIFPSDDVIIERLNNISAADTKAYLQSFTKLLDLFAPWLPTNLAMRIARVGDLYDSQASMERELSANLGPAKQHFDALDNDAQEQLRTSALLNLRWDGPTDLTNLSEAEKQVAVEQAIVLHGAYCQLSRRLAFNRAEDAVAIFPTPVNSAIAIGTTKSSVTKFWTGFGALERGRDGYICRVLPPTRIGAFSNQRAEPAPVELHSLRNLQSITLIPPG